MAASPTPRPKPASAADSAAGQALAGWWQRHGHTLPPGPLAVAFSGGADSTALLHAAVALGLRPVVALHVHHGLQAAADGFAAHAERTAQALNVPLRLARVDARPEPGQSPEDAARQWRYQALAQLASEAPAASVVLLGQHADDQAETVLLALSRGAGLPGLAAMPERFERHGTGFGRPLLAVPGEVLRQDLTDAGHRWIDDPTNTDPRYTRNRIRHQLLPAWRDTLGDAVPALARTARHAAQAQRLLDELAALDAQQVGLPPAIAALQTLSADRQANLIRHWLRQCHGVAPSAAQLDALLPQVAACTTRGHRIQLHVAAGFVVRQGGALQYTPSV